MKQNIWSSPQHVLPESLKHLTVSPSGHTNASDILKQLQIHSLSYSTQREHLDIPLQMLDMLSVLADQDSLRCSLPILLTPVRPSLPTNPTVCDRISDLFILLLPDLQKTHILQVKHNDQQQQRGSSLNMPPGQCHSHTYAACFRARWGTEGTADTTHPVFREGENIGWMIPAGKRQCSQYV